MKPEHSDIADAGALALALADPDNPYTALRKFLEGQVHQLEQR